MTKSAGISPKFWRRKGLGKKPGGHSWRGSRGRGILPLGARTVAMAALAFLCVGCSGVEFLGGDYASLIEIAKRGWGGASGADVSYDTVASMPFASIGFRVGNGGQNMLLLVGEVREPYLWTAAGRVAVVTEDGRIIRTGGLPYNLGGWSLQSVSSGHDGGVVKRWFADFPDMQSYSLPIECSQKLAGEETVTVLGRKIAAKRFDEHCESTSSDVSWSFDNIFWRDEKNGTVLRSIQHVHPKLPPLEVELFRPPLSSK